MTTDTRIGAFEQRLTSIEKDIEEENERANINRMKARYFMFFLLFGADGQTRDMLERKVRDLLCNPNACAFLQMDGEAGAAASCDEAFEQVLLQAANRHVDVQNLNTVFLCPVLFVTHMQCEDVVPVLQSVDRFVQLAGKTPIWQPFAVMQRSVSQYANLHRALSQIGAFIRADKSGSVQRCCLLSDQDSNGFSVPQENIMQTIAMTVALQNVETQSAGAAQPIYASVKISSNAAGDGSLFFTARNAAITNPVRSLTLQRMNSAMDFFAGKTDDACEAALGRLDYSFVRQVLQPYMEKLPTLYDKVTFFPLYAVIGGADLQKRLQAVIDAYYVAPLRGGGAEAAQLAAAKEAFLQRFFAANGSLAMLRELAEEKKLSSAFLQYSKNAVGMLPLEDPLPNRPKLAEFNSGLYLQARRYCEDLVCKAEITLLEQLGDYLCSNAMIAAVSHTEQVLKQAQACVAARIRTLRNAETVLVLEQTVRRTDFDAVQAGWFADRAADDPARYAGYNKRFDAMIYQMLLEDGQTDYSALLEICYQAVKGSGYSNMAYLQRLSEECERNEDRAAEFASIVEKSWCYTLRFLKHDENSDTTCIIGDPKNRFCSVLQQRFKGSLFAFNGFDRIDVLHISAPFRADNIWEWEQIRQKGEQQG